MEPSLYGTLSTSLSALLPCKVINALILAVKMLLTGLRFAFCILCLAGPSSAQKSLLLRLATDHATPMAHEEKCVLVYSDARYHFERIFSDHPNHMKATVVEGTLPDPQFAQLQSVLNTDEIKDLKGLPGIMRYPFREFESADVLVHRGNSMQHVGYANYFGIPWAEPRAITLNEDVHKKLKPLLSWFKQVERLKEQPVNNLSPSRCVHSQLGS